MESAVSVRDARKVYHFWLDDALVDEFGPTIGAHGLAVYLVLARHAKHGQAYPSVRRIARLAKMKQDTVRKYLALLVDYRLITITPRYDDLGDPTSNLYTLLDLSHLYPRRVDPPLSAPIEGGGTPSPGGRVPPQQGVGVPPKQGVEVVPLGSTTFLRGGEPAPAQKMIDSPVGKAWYYAEIMTPALPAWVQDMGLTVDLEREFERWYNYSVAHGKEYHDVAAAFRQWLLQPFAGEGRARHGNTPLGSPTRLSAALSRFLAPDDTAPQGDHDARE